uniref:Putative secreted protein n=1 Tax=Panstrongylus lignarius TaxID=156445 RepID=A0A224Y479_9HEMI
MAIRRLPSSRILNALLSVALLKCLGARPTTTASCSPSLLLTSSKSSKALSSTRSIGFFSCFFFINSLAAHKEV